MAAPLLLKEERHTVLSKHLFEQHPRLYPGNPDAERVGQAQGRVLRAVDLDSFAQVCRQEDVQQAFAHGCEVLRQLLELDVNNLHKGRNIAGAPWEFGWTFSGRESAKRQPARRACDTKLRRREVRKGRTSRSAGAGG